MEKSKKNFFSLFPALSSRNYRLYFMGQTVSLVGTWLQVVAEGWLVITFTKSPFIIGLIAALATIPTLFLSAFSGVIVDHFSKYKILFLTQTLSLVIALIYGFMTIFHVINLFEIGILAFLLGVVTALDFPARQAFTVEMVEKQDLSSAIALNSGTFNASRVIGPSVAGILIGLLGVGGAFILNGLSYIAVIVALYKMNIHERIPETFTDPFKSFKEGLSYSFNHPKIKSLLIFTAFASIFGWSYTTVLPLLAKSVFHVGATELGYLFAAAGFGSVLAMVILSAFAKKVDPMNFIISGNAISAIGLIGFTFTRTLFPAYVFLFITGLGVMLCFPTINTTLQHLVPDEIRGRVMAIYITVFVGFFPIGNFEIGWVSEHVGPENAIRISAVIIFIAGAFLYMARDRVEKLHQEYIEASSFNEGQVNL